MILRPHENGEEPDPLEDDFPLGDGTADMGGESVCPYCGESVELTLDPGSGSSQTYVEDCPVCCSPWLVRVRYDAEGTASISLDRADPE